MTVWRPPSSIRVKALGLHWRAGRLLAAEVPGDDGRIEGVRPLGGSIAFGETAQAAVIREFHEELGLCVRTLGPPVFLENLYTHAGSPGHEILAIFEVVFPPGAFAGVDRIAFHEDDGTRCHAQWFDPSELDRPGRPRLFPPGLRAHLRGQ